MLGSRSATGNEGVGRVVPAEHDRGLAVLSVTWVRE